jgi:hypothetical protein
LYLGTADTNLTAQLEVQFIVSLEAGLVASYLSLVRDALRAEITGFPAPRKLAADQLEAAEDAYALAFVGAIDAQPNAEALYRAADYPRAVSPSLVCEFTAIAMEASDRVQGLLRDDVILMVVLSMQLQ